MEAEATQSKFLIELSVALTLALPARRNGDHDRHNDHRRCLHEIETEANSGDDARLFKKQMDSGLTDPRDEDRVSVYIKTETGKKLGVRREKTNITREIA
jgi:hypothetical protein